MTTQMLCIIAFIGVDVKFMLLLVVLWVVNSGVMGICMLFKKWKV